MRIYSKEYCGSLKQYMPSVPKPGKRYINLKAQHPRSNLQPQPPKCEPKTQCNQTQRKEFRDVLFLPSRRKLCLLAEVVGLRKEVLRQLSLGRLRTEDPKSRTVGLGSFSYGSTRNLLMYSSELRSNIHL